jgi:citrate lyase subunit alpha/citrate CoA-transferase
MKNSLGRVVPDTFTPFTTSDAFTSIPRKQIQEKSKNQPIKVFHSMEDLIDELQIKDGATLSFHHHLRSGDDVINRVCTSLHKRQIRNLTLAPSSIFPTYTGIELLIKAGFVKDIHTNYLSGGVSDLIHQGLLQGLLIMNTHGGRARLIESGDVSIDVAFLSTPAVDKQHNGCGTLGKNACGTLGYAQSDLRYAKQVVLVTDSLVDKIEQIDFDHHYVDYVLLLDSIGEAEGIVSGTTKLTKDPVGIKIAKDTTKLINALGLIKNGFSMQTGAGGISLAVAEFVKHEMIKQGVIGSFASGGIGKQYVQMLELGLFERLYDVQCFDLDAVSSYKQNRHHLAMSASQYGNPFEADPIVNQLDVVVLGATEIDLSFHTNVTTDSFGKVIGGSGGHSDTAYGAKVSIITTQLIKSRLPIIKKQVTTITTPGETVDVLVTERGIAINPLRKDLIELLQDSTLPITSIESLYELQHTYTGIPATLEQSSEVVGVVMYRDGSIVDTIRKKIS